MGRKENQNNNWFGGADFNNHSINSNNLNDSTESEKLSSHLSHSLNISKFNETELQP